MSCFPWKVIKQVEIELHNDLPFLRQATTMTNKNEQTFSILFSIIFSILFSILFYSFLSFSILFFYYFFYFLFFLVRGCSAAVLRVWYSASTTPVELCGVKASNVNWTYLSEDNNMRLRLVTDYLQPLLLYGALDCLSWYYRLIDNGSPIVILFSLLHFLSALYWPIKR